jgi:predicted negative regulator of RcsB-dependent stress response
VNKRIAIAAFVASLVLVFSASTARSAESDANTILDGFAAAVEANPSIAPENKRQAAAILRELRETPEDRAAAIMESLRVIYPEFKEALAAVGEDNLAAATASLTKLRQSSDAYLAAAATFYLARTQLLDERFEDAIPLLADLESRWVDKTTNGGEVLFLRGVAEMALLKHQKAAKSLSQFLSDYPDAPERMRVGALRQLEQLKQFQEGTLNDARLRMDYSRRKLTLEDTGTETRQQQDKIVEILAGLIKEAQERESKSRGGGSGKSQQQGQPGEEQGQAQGEGSQGGATGGGSKGIDTDALNRLHRGGPQSPWSKLRDKERDPVYSAIKEKFPARYQQLIEQYYKSFQDDDGR